jgi:hypothetical protein
LRCGTHEHLARGRADSPQRLPIQRRRPATAGELLAVSCRIAERLFDMHTGPIHVQLFRDQHRQHGLDALPYFRVLGQDGDGAVVGYLYEGVERARRFLRIIAGAQHSGQ